MKNRVSLVAVAIVLLCIRQTLNATRPQNQFFRTYECVTGNCRRTGTPIKTFDPNDSNRVLFFQSQSRREHTSLEACRLVCGDAAGLWPIPTVKTEIGDTYVRIDPLRIDFEMKDVPMTARPFLTEVSAIFTSNVQLTCGPQCERTNSAMKILMEVDSDEILLDWKTNESYTLQVSPQEENVEATIKATTIYGARHALETLSQLIVRVITKNNGKGLVVVNRASIADEPIFPHRGLLIDTARNYLPIIDILRTIDALGSTKMNVLHWHVTDSQSFPLLIKSRPLMALYGAYDSKMTYSLQVLSHVAVYAKFRGVRIILELDSPSHTGAGWEWGPFEGLGDLAVCVNRQPWRDYCIQPPCGQLNPVNPNTYDVLRDIYREVLDAIGTNSVLHLGGDEVHMNCWNSTPEIVKVMESRGMGRTTDDFLKLWGDLHKKQKKMLEDIQGESGDVLLWSSALTSPEVITRYLDKNRFIVQTWVPASSSIPNDLLKLGYRIIISTKNAWYLDHGFWGDTRYYTWRDAYNNRIPRTKGVLGGEACMWGEYVNAGSLDSKVWPRAAALAERLWSDLPSRTTTIDVERRLQSHKTRLETRNINGDALTPEWCNQHEKMCM